jgi:hypothetical protein
MVISLILIYALYNFKLMLFFDNTTITKMTYYRTLSDDLSSRNASEFGFDIAFSLIDFSGNS